MESSVLDAALSQGIWAVLAVFLLIYIVKSNERFSARQEEREKQYQELLSALTEKFNVLSVIEKDIADVKEYIMADTKEIPKFLKEAGTKVLASQLSLDYRAKRSG